LGSLNFWDNSKGGENAGGSADGGKPCVAGEFRAALDTLFETLDETQPWYVFCVNPNDSQLPNQLEERSVKGQVRSMGLAEIAKRCVFEASLTPREFCERYKDGLEEVGAGTAGWGDRERVEQAKRAFGFEDAELVLGQQKVL